MMKEERRGVRFEMSPLARSELTLFVVVETVDSQSEHVVTLCCTIIYVTLYSTCCTLLSTSVVLCQHTAFINIHF